MSVSMQPLCVCGCVRVLVHVCAGTVCDSTTGSSLQPLGALVGDKDGSADSIPPLPLANFEFNHCSSTVFQITLGSSTPSHYPGHNWILEKPRGQARPANLLLICLWLVWPEPFSGCTLLSAGLAWPRKRQGPRWERRRCTLNKDQGLGAFGGHPLALQGTEWCRTIFPSQEFPMKEVSVAALCPYSVQMTFRVVYFSVILCSHTQAAFRHAVNSRDILHKEMYVWTQMSRLFSSQPPRV